MKKSRLLIICGEIVFPPQISSTSITAKAPGLAVLNILLVFLVIHPVIIRECQVVSLHLTAHVLIPDEFTLGGHPAAYPVHTQETVQERKDREIDRDALKPVLIGTPGTNKCGLFILVVGPRLVAHAHQEPGVRFMCAADFEQHPNFIIICAELLPEVFNLFFIRNGALFYE